MASPQVSFVVYRRDGKDYELHHRLNPPAILNSHGQITSAAGLPDGQVYRVEIWPTELADKQNTEPVPWTIDKLPEGITYIEDVPEHYQNIIEEACKAFMTPDNVYAYLHAPCGDVQTFVAQVFTEEYYEKWRNAVYDNGTTLGLDNVHALFNACLMNADTTRRREDVWQYKLVNNAAIPTVPRFTVADIRNPAVWAELPEEDAS